MTDERADHFWRATTDNPIAGICPARMPWPGFLPDGMPCDGDAGHYPRTMHSFYWYDNEGGWHSMSWNDLDAVREALKGRPVDE